MVALNCLVNLCKLSGWGWGWFVRSPIDAVVRRLRGELPKQHQELLECTRRTKCLIRRHPFNETPLWLLPRPLEPTRPVSRLGSWIGSLGQS